MRWSPDLDDGTKGAVAAWHELRQSQLGKNGRRVKQRIREQRDREAIQAAAMTARSKHPKQERSKAL